MPDGGFPRALLDQSAEVLTAYFRAFTMAHPLLKEADVALKQAIQDPAGWSLILRLWADRSREDNSALES